MKGEIFQTILILAVLLAVSAVVSQISQPVSIFLLGLFIGVLLSEVKYQRIRPKNIENPVVQEPEVIKQVEKPIEPKLAHSLRIVGRAD